MIDFPNGNRQITMESGSPASKDMSQAFHSLSEYSRFRVEVLILCVAS